MNFKTKIIIDKVFGLPMVYGLNVLARVLGFLLRIDHSLDKPVNVIAICKFVGLGSIIQATPLIQTLRKNYPEARIIFISNESNKGLLDHIIGIDEAYAISDKGINTLIVSSIKLLFKLWKQKPDVYIDLEIYSNYSSVMATMSLSKNRMGFFKNDKMYRKGMYTHMLFFNLKAPVSQTYLQFARLLGCSTVVSELALNMDNSEPNALKTIAQKLNAELYKYIVINPNASDLRLERRWGMENFVILLNRINEGFPDYKIILIGADNEAPYVKRIISHLLSEKMVIDSSGRLSIRELLFLIANANLVITNDTGPMHMAFALRTKTVSLFGPCSPQQYGGMENTATVYKNVYCSPCVHEFLIPPCKGDNQCMKKITVEEVFNSARTMLNSMENSILNEFPVIEYTNSDSIPLGVVMR